MTARNYLVNVAAIVLLALAIQHVLILYVPNIIFAIAKKRSQKPLNTVIHAPKTDANLRRVVLPNPDFVYSAVFYDVTKHDVIVSCAFPDSAQYASLAFYGNNMQPYCVVNNQKGITGEFQFRLSSKAGQAGDLARVVAKSPQGSILVRLLYNGNGQLLTAQKLQKKLNLVVIE